MDKRRISRSRPRETQIGLSVHVDEEDVLRVAIGQELPSIIVKVLLPTPPFRLIMLATKADIYSLL